MSQNIKDKIKESTIVAEGKRGIFQVVFGRTMLIIVLIVLQFLFLFAQFFAWAKYVPLLLGSKLIVVAFMMFFVLNTEGNPSIKLTWCIIIGIAPILGSVLYLFARYEIGHHLERKVIQHTIAESRKFLEDQSEQLEKVKDDKELSQMAGYLRTYSGSTLYANTKVRYFPIGELQFEEILKQLEKAENFIYMEYFMIAKGHMWKEILEILVRKAQEGVDVRVMYDGNCAIYLLPYGYPKQLQKMGIKCRMFSPLIPFASTHYNNRDHRKILVIDGYTAFTGGINICDEYINEKEMYGHWKDVGIMLQGDAVRDFTLMFLQMWNSMEKEQVYEKNRLDASVPYEAIPEKRKAFSEENKENQANGYVIPYYDSPMDKENVGEMVYMDILNRAKDYVYIMTPYLILDNEMLTALKFAAKRSVDVRIILPHIPDKRYAFVLAKEHYKELLEAGVKIYEYTPGFVHAKVFVSDDRKAVVGTINMDYRSLYLHFENAAYLYEVPAVQDILTDFKEILAKCQQVTMETIKKRGILSKAAGGLLKLIAPLM